MSGRDVSEQLPNFNRIPKRVRHLCPSCSIYALNGFEKFSFESEPIVTVWEHDSLVPT